MSPTESIQSLCPHINLANPSSYQQTPFDWFKELRSNHPVIWHDDPETGVGFWVVTKREDIDYISRHPRLFSSSKRGFVFNEHSEEHLQALRNMILCMDPPDHIKYRKIIAAAFKPQTIDAMEPFLRREARSIVDKIAPRGECEFVTELAAHLPMAVICKLVGAPLQDGEKINR